MNKFETENKDCGAFATISTDYIQIGLTKREYFAGLAMQGMLANVDAECRTHAEIIKISIDLTDELLKQLDSHE